MIDKKAQHLPASNEEIEVALVTSGPGNELQAFNSFHPVIHSTQNDLANVICEKRNIVCICNQEKSLQFHIIRLKICDKNINMLILLSVRHVLLLVLIGRIFSLISVFLFLHDL